MPNPDNTIPLDCDRPEAAILGLRPVADRDLKSEEEK